jgi:hypothetical protein
MTAESPIPSPFPAVRGSAQRWRGECIGLFAEAEQRLSAVLVRTSNVPAYAAVKPAFPHLVGQKFERLRKLVGLDGPMKRHAASALSALDAFALHNGLRTILCHGELEVAVTENESRIFLFRFVNFRNGVASTTTSAFSHAEADTRRNELMAATTALKAELSVLEKALPRSAPAGSAAVKPTSGSK